MFDSDKDHKKALDLFFYITQRNESLPLEQKICGVIIRLDGKDDTPPAGVYMLSRNFAVMLAEQGVSYTILQNENALFNYLSEDGVRQLFHVQKHRPHDFEQAKD